MPKPDETSTRKPTHSGVVAYRIQGTTPEILLVTAIGSGRWIIPKGRIDDKLGSRESARYEAFEEAGIKGELEPTPFDLYTHGGDETLVEVFLMKVTSEGSPFPEEDVRKKRWVPLGESRKLVDDPELRFVLKNVAARAALITRPESKAQRRENWRSGTIALAIVALLFALGVVARNSRARDHDQEEAALTARTAEASAVDKVSEPASTAVCQAKGELVSLPGVLSEASGAAVSATHAGIIWTHNDSGEPYVYAVDRQGNARGRVRLTGAQVVDWESIDVGPCPSGQCLHIGDIGDNEGKREEVVIYRLAEPAPSATSSARVEAIRAKYPDGPHDAEAFFVSPEGVIHIVTKGEGERSAVYRLARAVGGARPATLELVRTLSDGKARKSERVTDADISADGRWIVLRSNSELSFYRANDFAGGSPAAMRMDLKSLNEAQGEGVAFGATNAVLVLTSEGGKKNKPGTLAELNCVLDAS